MSSRAWSMACYNLYLQAVPFNANEVGTALDELIKEPLNPMEE
jgi:hypothetical protein